MRKITKKTAVILAASTLLVAVGGGVAFAYWTSAGSGSGTAATSNGGSNLSISQLTAPNDLAPGVAPKAVTGTITNNAANSARVGTLTVTITGVDQAHSGGCTAADFGLTTGTTALTKGSSDALSVLPLTVNTELASKGTFDFTFNIGFANDPANAQDGCKGATPMLSYSTN